MPGRSVKIYEAWVVGVKPVDRVIDVKTIGGTDFKNVSYLLPYINLLGGGLDAVPQSGDRCLLLASDLDTNNTHRSRWVVCIGFALPVTPESGGLELGGRLLDFPPGSIALSAAGEDGSDARVICYQGGSVFIGSGLSASTLYSPIDKSIAHLFDNWKMMGPGGHIHWTRETGQETVVYEAEYRTVVDEEDTSAMKVNIRIGGEGDNPVEVTVNQGELDPPVLRIFVDAEGEATIQAQALNLIGDKIVNIDGGQVTIKGKQVLSEGDPI